MKKFLIFITIIFCLSANATAQITARWSEDIKLPSGHSLDEPLGIQDGLMYLTTSKMVYYSGYYPYVCTANTKSLTLSEPVPLKSDDKKQKFIGSVFNNKGKWGVFQMIDQERNNYIKIFPFNKNAETLNDQATAVAGFREVKGVRAFGSNVYIRTSPDSSKNAIFIQAERRDKENMLFYIITCDAEMKMLWKQVIELPYNAKRFTEGEISVMNTGQVAFSGKRYEDKKAKERKSKTEANYQHLVRLYDGKDADGKEFIVDLEGKFVVNTKLVTRPDNGNVVLVGTYANLSVSKMSEYDLGFERDRFPMSRNGVINGLFMMEINNEGKVVNNFLTPIEAKNIKNLSRYMLEKKGDGIDADMCIKKVFFNNDGNMVVAAEPTFMEVYTTTDSKGNTKTHYRYYAMDNLVFSFNPKGDVNWMACVPKAQVASSSYPIGSTIFYRNNTTYFVYNDIPNSQKKEVKETKRGSAPKLQMMGTGSKVDITLVKIDNKGNISKEVLSSKKEMEGFLFFPNQSKALSENELLFVSGKFNLFGKAKYRLASLKLK